MEKDKEVNMLIMKEDHGFETYTDISVQFNGTFSEASEIHYIFPAQAIT